MRPIHTGAVFSLVARSALCVVALAGVVSGCRSQQPSGPSGGLVGVYTGTGQFTNTNCTDASTNRDYSSTVRIEITAHTGSTFVGLKADTFTFQGVTLTGVDAIDGTMSGNDISGTLEGGLLGTTSAGTFTGQVNGSTLTMAFVNRDVSGETCTTTGSATATKQ